MVRTQSRQREVAKAAGAKVLFPLYAVRDEEETFLILTNGKQEFIVRLGEKDMKNINKQWLGVSDIDRPSDIPAGVVMQLAEREVVGKVWLGA